MKPFNFFDLAWPARVGICWGFLWRGLFATLGSSLAGVIVGGGVGLLLSILFRLTSWCACDYRPITSAVGSMLGVCCGLFGFYLYVGWILRAKLGKFQLVLVKDPLPAA